MEPATLEPIEQPLEKKAIGPSDLFGEEAVSKLSSEALLEVEDAVKVIASIYPYLRSDAPIIEGDNYEIKRANFKDAIDFLESALMVIDKHIPSEIPTFHKFTPGMYVREIHVPAGAIFTSVTHKTQHPFVLSKGVCDICNEVGKVTRYEAPHTGITNPGTRRVFLVHSDIVFTTFHATDITDPDEWLLQNTTCENQNLPGEVKFKCFSRKELKWQE